MSTFGSRLRELRESKGLSLDELARISGITRDHIGRIERDESVNPRRATTEALAKALGVPAWQFIDFGEAMAEEDRPPGAFEAPAFLPENIPVVSLVKAGRGGFFDANGYPVGEGFRKITRPEWIKDKNAYAVQIDGDSMSPALEKGWIAVVCPHDQVVNGNLVIAKIKDEYLIKKIKFQDNLIVFQSINPSHEPIACKKSEVDWVHKVCLIKPK